ncbi:Hint domain-containing protein [Marinovum sp.]|uniref:Hint domain-containing protein n=1 Tax=Marinovum sp. TaxID=2024839 RepID=UPI002B27A84F|nr:Hint domain-containing protein [Marinovum sp.]
MKAGYRGTFVISWSQTDIDGFAAASLSSLRVGAGWSWQGEALCVDGPSDVLRLDGADGDEALRRRAAHKVRKLVGAALTGQRSVRPVDTASADTSFIVTDGVKSYPITMIPAGRERLLMFVGEMPPRKVSLWVVHLDVAQHLRAEADDPGVICFTPGTLIDTPDGPRPVEDLRDGCKVLTRDNGPQEVLWTGARRMSGARLHAMPTLRPVRIFAGAFGRDKPETSFLVSPQHRMLLRGAEIEALFNTPEVLVAARDLAGTPCAQTDYTLREVTYVHLLLPRHEILWANGLETESFHPASAQLSTLDAHDRARLITGMPEVEHDPLAYGAYARRNLTASEYAVLRHHAA